MRSITEEDAYKGLANAIILRACEDYQDPWRREFCREFFMSEWFMLLSRGCTNGETVIQFLEKEKFAHGKKFFTEIVI